MSKRIAVLNIIAWGGFWAFGYLAVTADATQPGQMLIAGLLALLGGAVGAWCYLRLIDHSNKTGYSTLRPGAPRQPGYETGNEA